MILPAQRQPVRLHGRHRVPISPGFSKGGTTMKLGRSPYRSIGNRFHILLTLFLAQLLTAPLFERSTAAAYAAHIFFCLFLAAAAYSVRKSRFFKLAIVFGACAIMGETSNYFMDSYSVLVATNFISCAYLGLVTLLIATTVARQREISADIVMGGLCVYVLMGVFWTNLFVNLEILKPGSFSFGVHGPQPDLKSFYNLLFFYSYVTLLTIGYGDVVPMSGMAQTLTILEGLIGKFYMIFFMASLVGLYIYRRKYSPPEKKNEDC
jgi:hypothetical protein